MLVLFDNQRLTDEKDRRESDGKAAIVLTLATAPITPAANTACECGGIPG